MATRNVTYQFDGYFATYDRNTEQEQIDRIELEQNYLAKFDVNIEEREIIDEGNTQLIVQNGELVLQGWLLP